LGPCYEKVKFSRKPFGGAAVLWLNDSIEYTFVLENNVNYYATASIARSEKSMEK
jgi:hypothetical protein